VTLSKQTNAKELFFGVALTALISALFGQIVGSMMFEITRWPTLIPELNSWIPLWQTLTFLYPVERAMITLLVTFIGVPLIRALKAWGYKIGGK
jgi:hypothetical protein